MTDLYRDKHGVEFGRVRAEMGERVANWSPVHRKKASEPRRIRLIGEFHAAFDLSGCWLCGITPGMELDSFAECHHITGNGCRSEERTSYSLVCRRCHRERIPNHDLWLPRLLFKKWELDRRELDWIRLTMIVGKHLPLLEPPPAGQSCWPWESEKARKRA